VDAVLVDLLAVLMFLILAAVLFLVFLQLRSSKQEVQSAILTERLSQIEPVTRNIQLGLTELQAYARARHDLERQTAESIRRLEAVIAGTQTKGAAGENILELVFAKLPSEWQVRNFRVGNKTVEFGLRLPNNLLLPIDSKWPATNLLEEFAGCDDPGEQQRLKSRIESAVLSKAREVKKYIDPGVTVNFGVAAVPDAIYELCSGVQADLFHLNVVLVSYSMFVPYLLLVFQTMLKTSQSIDVQRLDAYLRNAQDSVEALQDEIEGRFSRALTMLANSRNDMSVHLSKVSSGLTSLQVGAANPGADALMDSESPDGSMPDDMV
jgi:DNA recombination protein RmuC